MRAEVKRLWAWMTVFFIAMAFLESAVVVYLRELYYPDGFRFPLAPMDPVLVATEMGRELATLVMLLAPAALVTRSALERFAWFCFGFGVWDIFYYVWLKVLLDWPASLAEPDLLFLLPVPWVGPVWAPCVVSMGLIALAVLLLRGTVERPQAPDRPTWVLLILSATLWIGSFVIEPMRQMASSSSSWTFLDGFFPDHYPWPVALTAALCGGAALVRLAVRDASC